MSSDELMSMKAVLKFFGGDKPINPSTLYRGIAAGRYPRAVKIAPKALLPANGSSMPRNKVTPPDGDG